MPKTPLRYPGGKSRVAEYLVSLFPSFDEYREPFLGGGSVFLETMGKHPESVFWINDLYHDLYCFWKGMIDSPDEVIGVVEDIRNIYSDGKKMYEDVLTMMDSERKFHNVIRLSAEFFIINRITFSGTSLSGGYSEESFNKRFTESSIERLDTLGREISGKENIHLTNLDFSDVICGESPFDNNGQVFLFLDPPYYTAENSALYGRNGDKHKGFDHDRLHDVLGCCGHKWIMTYDDCEYTRDMYQGYEIMPFKFAYGMRNTGNKENNMIGKELIISNYKINVNEQVHLF